MPKLLIMILAAATLIVGGGARAQSTSETSSEMLFDVLSELNLSRCGVGRTRCQAEVGEIHCVRHHILRSRYLHRCQGMDLPEGHLAGKRAKALFEALVANGVEADCGGKHGQEICGLAALSAHCEVTAGNDGHESLECSVDPAPAFQSSGARR